MVLKILKWSICAADVLLAAAMIMIAFGHRDIGQSLMEYPLIAMVVGIIAAAYAADKGLD